MGLMIIFFFFFGEEHFSIQILYFIQFALILQKINVTVFCWNLWAACWTSQVWRHVFCHLHHLLALCQKTLSLEPGLFTISCQNWNKVGQLEIIIIIVKGSWYFELIWNYLPINVWFWGQLLVWEAEFLSDSEGNVPEKLVIYRFSASHGVDLFL